MHISLYNPWNANSNLGKTLINMQNCLGSECICTPNLQNIKPLIGTLRCSATTWAGTVNATLQWRHNELDGVSNHQPHDCLFNGLFRRRSKNTSKLRVTGPCRGIHRGSMNSPHKGPVTQKMFLFDGVIMLLMLGCPARGGSPCQSPGNLSEI